MSSLAWMLLVAFGVLGAIAFLVGRPESRPVLGWKTGAEERWMPAGTPLDTAAGFTGPDRRQSPARLADPMDVVRLRLTREAKIRVLQQWRYDILELQVGGTERRSRRGEMLRRIDAALAAVESQADAGFYAARFQ